MEAFPFRSSLDRLLPFSWVIYYKALLPTFLVDFRFHFLGVRCNFPRQLSLSVSATLEDKPMVAPCLAPAEIVLNLEKIDLFELSAQL